MKKIVLFFLPALLLFCSKPDEEINNEEEAYTVEQEKVFDVLTGSFQQITTIMSVEIKGNIITFNKRFDKPVGIRGESCKDCGWVAFYAHGDGKFKDIQGSGSLSYDFYYSVSEPGIGLNIYKKKDNYSMGESPYLKCTLEIKDKDNFTIYYNSALPAGGVVNYRRIN